MKQNIVERQIMWGDLDALGIVFYPRFYEWMDGCAHLFLDKLGLEQMELWRKRSMIFGLVETGCRYAQPVRYHHKICIATDLSEIGRKTLTLRHRVVSAGEGTSLLEGFEKRICMNVTDPSKIRGMEIPDDIRSILQQVM